MHEFRFALDSDRIADIARRLKGADFVEKVFSCDA